MLLWYNLGMKNILIISVAALALASCSTQPQPPAPTVSGTWTGAITTSDGAYPVTVTLNQTNTPNPGDFTGGYRFGTQTHVSPVTGNVNTGVLAWTRDTTITCTGTFTGVTRYTGECSSGTGPGSLQGTLALNKQP